VTITADLSDYETLELFAEREGRVLQLTDHLDRITLLEWSGEMWQEVFSVGLA
jgi:hypothetical protein